MARARFARQHHPKKHGGIRALSEDEVSKRKLDFMSKSKKTGTFGAARNSPYCQRWANVRRFGVTLLLFGFATGCTEQSVSDAATLLAIGLLITAAR